MDYYNILVVGLAGPPPSDDIIYRHLYRSTDGGHTRFFIKRLAGTDLDTFWDFTAPGYESTDIMANPGVNLPPPVATWAFSYRGRTYYGGVKAAPSHLFYSRPNGLQGAVAFDSILDVASSDGDVLTGFSITEDYVAIFKRRSIYLLTATKDGTPVITPAVRGVGAVSDLSIVSFSGKSYFLSDSGYFAFNGSDAVPISSEINKLVKALPGAYLEDAFSWVDRDRRRICICVSTKGNTHSAIGDEIWMIHPDTGGVTRTTGANVSCATEWTGKDEVVTGFYSNVAFPDSYDGVVDGQPSVSVTYVKIWDLGLWDHQGLFGKGLGSQYPGTFETSWLSFDNPDSDKTFYRIDVIYSQTTSLSMNVSWAVDWDDRRESGTDSASLVLQDPDAVMWDVYDWGATSLVAPDTADRTWDKERTRTRRINLDKVTAKSIRFKFDVDHTGEYLGRFKNKGGDYVNQYSDSHFKIIGFTIHYEDHGIRSEGVDLDT